jgi:MinD superfamily P-loop ATPase
MDSCIMTESNNQHTAPRTIVVASGKGGTGKTTVAANLAVLAARAGQRVAYLDCDVEAPNGAIFLQPAIAEEQEVTRAVPDVDADACVNCGLCGQICRFSAIVPLPTQVLIYPELCHGCSGCVRLCPAQAIHERPWPIGTLSRGAAGAVAFRQGRLNVGEAMSPPLIRAVKDAAPRDADLVVIDAPPGTACPAIETVRGADAAVLVTEPTPFGLNDLALAVEMTRMLDVPAAVVVNRAADDDRVHRFCAAEGVEVIAEIADDRRVAEAYSRGELLCDAVPQYAAAFEQVLARLPGYAPAGMEDGNR